MRKFSLKTFFGVNRNIEFNKEDVSDQEKVVENVEVKEKAKVDENVMANWLITHYLHQPYCTSYFYYYSVNEPIVRTCSCSFIDMDGQRVILMGPVSIVQIRINGKDIGVQPVQNT